MRDQVRLDIDGREVKFSSPGKVFFADAGITKLDLCEYYLAVADAILPHLRGRPTSMKRFPNGAAEDFFFQKRVPKGAPEWIEQMTVSFPSGRSANYLVCQDRAHLAWACNLGVIDWNPWAVRRPDGDHPDELRIDLDPTPQSSDWSDVRKVALAVRELDYNQNARDRTIASAYSVRPNPQACVSAPLTWDELPDAELGDFTLRTVPPRLEEVGDVSAGLHETAGSLEGLLELAARDETGGLGDAPWPPHLAKQRGEPRRVQPSKAKKKD